MFQAERALLAPPWIRFAHADGGLVILNFRTESYLVFDSVSTAMWSVLIGQTKWADTRHILLEDYEVAPSLLDADLAAFADRCLADELLVKDGWTTPWIEHSGSAQSSRSHRPAIPAPSMLRAVWSLYQTNHYLTHNGFRCTYERYGRMPAGEPVVTLDVALARFCLAEHFFVGHRAPDDCLLRSLALFRFL